MACRGPHQLNTGFSWIAPPGPFTALTAEQSNQWNEQGFFVVHGGYSGAEIEAMVAEIDPFQERISRVLDRRLDKPGYTIASNLVMRSDRLRDVCRAEPLRTLAGDLLGRGARLFWEQAVYKGPEHSGEFAWHQDNGKVFIDPQQYITCWVALTDATIDNGCVIVAPGLHTMGTLEHWQSKQGWVCLDDEPESTVPIPLRAGDIAVFSSVTTHMTSSNRTNDTRKAYVVQYAPAGARSIERSPDGTVSTTAQDLESRQFIVA